MGAGVVGGGAGRHRWADTEGDRRGTWRGDHVPRRAARLRRHDGPRHEGVGDRRPQLPHEHLQLGGATRLRALAPE